MLQSRIAFTLCISTTLYTLFCVSAHTHEIRGTSVQILPAYAIASLADLVNSTKCGRELHNFRNAVDQRIPWSLKVLDSSGGYESGFLYGNTYWLGSRSQCLDTMNTAPLQISEQKISNVMLHRDPQKEFPPFEINYFVAHLRHNSSLKYYVMKFNEDVITLGLCLPASCTTNELILILEKIFHDKITLIHDLYSVNFQLIQVKDLRNNNEWLSSNALLLVCIALVFSFIMTTTGTVYDIFVHQKHIMESVGSESNENVEHVFKDTKTNINLSSYWASRIGKILICFSAYTNTREIFSTKLDTDEVSAFHGVKFLHMCGNIIVHTSYFAMDFFDNKIWLWRQINNTSNFIIGIGYWSIDCFYFLSGCLVTYSYLRNKTNRRHIEPTNWRENLIEIFVHIIKRFIRLTPAYMVVLGIVQFSSVWFDRTSQFYLHDRLHETCTKYWWRNLLYINNFFGIDSMCMIWSWYIANDMQFYIIAITLLILSTTYFYTAVMLLSSLLIGSIVLTGYTSYVYEIVPHLKFNERSIEHMNVFYFLPWIRISPYLIGIITGYILTKAKNLILKRKIIILCSCFFGACHVFLLYVFYMRHMSILAAAVYISLYKVFWTIPLAWLTILCFTKLGGILNQFLSFKVWVPLSRITYCSYLLNPLIIRTIYLHNETSIHYVDLLSTIVMGIGCIVIVYICSYVLSVMVERPCILLMRMFIEYCGINKREILHKKIS